MALPATDAFTGTSGTSLPTYSGSWTVNNGAFAIRSNNVGGSSAGNECGARWNADTFNNDQYSQATLIGVPSTAAAIGPACRVATGGAATYYGVYYDGGASPSRGFLFKMVAGTWTQIGTNISGVALNSVIKIDASSTTITAYDDGVSVKSGTDSAIASGSAGLTAYGADSTATEDNWEGGNLGGGGTTVTLDVASDAALSTTNTKDVASAGVTSTTDTKDVASEAALSETGTKDVAEDAVLTTTNTTTVAEDAVLTTTNTKDVASEAALSETITLDVSEDAVLTTTNTADVAEDAAVQGVASQTVTQDAALTTVFTLDVAGDGVLSATATQDLAEDAALSETGTKDVAEDATLSGTVTLDLAEAGVISTTNTVTTTSDATISAPAGGTTQTVAQEAAISATDYVLFLVYLTPAGQITLPFDAAIGTLHTADIAEDAAINPIAKVEIAEDAYIVLAGLGQADVTEDAALSTVFTLDVSQSGVLSETVTITIAEDAALSATGTKDVASSSVLTTTNVVTLTQDASLSQNKVDIACEACISVGFHPAPGSGTATVSRLPASGTATISRLTGGRARDTRPRGGGSANLGP